ncbi:hypothetical protein PN838_15200 [Psychrosphaera sp. G1-22]|uniref:Uncharacterized protein n=1 Tax=Psychrosphaera algicola TaxID=3023714 RepID=A0ABT5FGH2_9GAMM|nr:hypothetical protein [Psychrosphaera sp. G1-22]MDC2889865.1 hypothetical protein [Psychrosphaera sp. G1-22]
MTWNIPTSDDDKAFAEQHIPKDSNTFVIAPAASKKSETGYQIDMQHLPIMRLVKASKSPFAAVQVTLIEN